MHHSSYRDPLDGPPPKWKPHRPAPSQVQDNDWSWGHTGIKPPSDNVVHQTPSQLTPKTPAHVSISAVVRKKVTGQTVQLPVSPALENRDVSRPTTNEIYIANRILQLSDINELCTACSDPSGAKFQVLSAPLIKRLTEFIACEPINPEHVLFLLRKTLKITIPKK